MRGTSDNNESVVCLGSGLFGLISTVNLRISDMLCHRTVPNNMSTRYICRLK